MDSYQEKISLLQEMIGFALIDGELHDREYDFLEMVAMELEIEKTVFHKLFENRGEVTVIKDEFHRICQFYRLALLMHIDGVLHEKEAIAIKQIAIDMGLNPSATSRFLELIRKTKNRIIEPNEVYALFKEQRN